MVAVRSFQLNMPYHDQMVLLFWSITTRGGVLEAQYLTASAIFYKPQMNSRTVQGESTGVGALREGGCPKVVRPLA